YIVSWSLLFSNAPATSVIYTLSLHDALPIFQRRFLSLLGRGGGGECSDEWLCVWIRGTPRFETTGFGMMPMLGATPKLGETPRLGVSTIFLRSSVWKSEAVTTRNRFDGTYLTHDCASLSGRSIITIPCM